MTTDTKLAEVMRLIPPGYAALESAVAGILSELEAAQADARRWQWWVSDNSKPASFMDDFIRGMREDWTVDQWRAATDAAIAQGAANAQG